MDKHKHTHYKPVLSGFKVLANSKLIEVLIESLIKTPTMFHFLKQEIVASLGRELITEYGNGFSEKNLRRTIQFAEVFPEEKIVVTLLRQLSWSHFLALVPLKDPLQREFYTEMCRMERWSVHTLRKQEKSW